MINILDLSKNVFMGSFEITIVLRQQEFLFNSDYGKSSHFKTYQENYFLTLLILISLTCYHTV